MNNGHSTGYFHLERRTRQGDPISTYLFILALEILFLQVRQNIDIQGITIDGHEIKIFVYVDDAKFFTINAHSMELVLAICDTFQEFSSLKLNKEMSEACWIGSKKHDKDKPLNCRWINLTDDKICSLGVCHRYDPFIASKHNFLDLVQKLRECLQVWKLRSLSLAGKILIFNTLALSKSIYVATMIAPSKQFIDEANCVQKEFVWDNKRPKIKHCTLTGDNAVGGYKSVDIETKFYALKFIWIKKLLDDDFHPWKSIANHLYQSFGGVSVFHSNIYNYQQAVVRQLVDYLFFIRSLFSYGTRFVILNQLNPVKC